MAGHNTVNTRYTLASTTHPHTLIEKGPRIRNAKTVRLFPLQVIGKADILLLL